MTWRRGRLALRLALTLVALAAPLVPEPRRRAWRRQWDADLRHQRAFLAAADRSRRSSFDLAWRARGAFTHALVLRLRSFGMPSFLNDIRYGARMVTRRPGFTAVAVLLLGLGVGVNGTIFSWMEGFVVRPITGVADPGSLVAVHGSTRTRQDLSLSYPNFADLRDRRPESVAGMAAFRLLAVNLRAGDEAEAERAWGELVSANLFTVLGVAPLEGRLLQPDDDRAAGASPVIALSHRYWQRRFAGDPSVVGRVVQVNGTPFTVVGIAPPDFHGATTGLSVDLWIPLMMQPAVYPGAERLDQRTNSWLAVIARTAPGSDLRAAQAGVSGVAAQLAEEYPEANEGRGVVLYPLWRDPQSASAILGPVFGLLLAVTAVVLLIVCANLASLLIARGAVRRREIAVRLALGASRGRIIRQLLTENALLALAGGAAGLLFTIMTSQALGLFMPPTPLPIDTSVELSLRMPLVSFGLALLTTLVFGLAPAIQSSRPAVVPALKDTRGAIGGRRWLRSGLVVAQVALSILLLIGAGLFVRTFQHARTADAGFDLDQGWIASIDLLPAGYDGDRGTTLFRELLARVEAIPGVESAALGRDVPLTLGGSGSDTSPQIEGYVPAEGEEITVFYDRVSPGFFETLGIPLIAGRALTDGDAADAPRVMVVNRTMARRYWGEESPVGKRVRIGDWVTVVGVVEDVAYRSVAAPPTSFMYLPLYRYYRPDVALIVRTATEPGLTMGPAREAIRSLDPNVPLFDTRTVSAHKELSLFMPRMAAFMLGLFGGLALLLAAIGLYGLLAHAVTQRTPEIGVRLALGADRRRILGPIVFHGLRLTAGGAVIGLGLAAILMPLASSQLVGVGARDAATYGAAALVLLAGAAAASYLPARRAAALDPVRALRYE